jgi:hypothetical protein
MIRERLLTPLRTIVFFTGPPLRRPIGTTTFRITCCFFWVWEMAFFTSLLTSFFVAAFTEGAPFFAFVGPAFRRRVWAMFLGPVAFLLATPFSGFRLIPRATPFLAAGLLPPAPLVPATPFRCFPLLALIMSSRDISTLLLAISTLALVRYRDCRGQQEWDWSTASPGRMAAVLLE